MAAAEREREAYEKLSDEYAVKREAAAASEVAAMARNLVAAQVSLYWPCFQYIVVLLIASGAMCHRLLHAALCHQDVEWQRHQEL